MDWPLAMATVVQVHERECAVCTNDFTTPKILPCGHLLCRQCVISWMDSKSDAGCPLCTCPIVEHQGNSSRIAADVVDALPTDSVMEAIVESASILMNDGMCTACDDLKAEYICMQCLERMCASCIKIHKKMVVSRSHDVESVSTVTPERLAASRPALCADHVTEKAELFCVDHNLAICTPCFSNKHKACPDVKSLDEKMKSAEDAINSLREKLLKAEENLKQAIDKLNVRLRRADVTEQQNMALLDKTCDRLQSMVDECRKQVKKLISDSVSKFKKSLCDVKIELEKRLGKVTSHKHLVTRATTVRPRPALIHAAQTLTDRVNSLDLSDELQADPLVISSPEITKYCDDVVKDISDELIGLKGQLIVDEPPVLVFHETCGTNIRLSNFRKTARKVQRDKDNDVLIFSRDAMIVNVLYEVRIDEINTPAECYVYLGVTRVLPARLPLPSWSDHLKDSVILWENGVRDKDTSTMTNVVNALEFLQVGSRVGLLLDSSNNLHFYADGDDQGVAAKDVPQPCFAFFNLSYNVIQVTALPTSERT
ncbi:E3 ubiquitin-protein ligase TRIM33-like isoform X2 [Pomacea canaliculata]|uniref:E3 ubiquitin-protein ligase TRIM33-like isoform X2 n=1 Tax=Pomacea canaliculata TaxID=400727 RepID=UPI000D740026|nr:E3 ubiquitin-protein ligase TRIM33-like isoform X2 [Pomacea canaliculata]